MNPSQLKRITEFLSGYVTQERLYLFDKVLAFRTRYITVVLEDIYQSQNASAVLRSCDCFGIQDVHIIENRNPFMLNPHVERGSARWLTLKKHPQDDNNSRKAVRTLKAEGYRIVATSPHRKETSLEDFDLRTGKTALVFGSEKPGISTDILKEADEFLHIPMVGFTESLNISVSAAIILHSLTEKLHPSKEIHWKLSPEEKAILKLEWLKRSIRKSEVLVAEWMKRETLSGS
jgi:tRNA (guanosine-2'-O-)-methyltransferase